MSPAEPSSTIDPLAERAGDKQLPPSASGRTNYRWTLAIFCMLTVFVSYIDRVNLSVATPSIMKELHFSKVQIGTLQTIFFFCYAVFQLPSGPVTEYFGSRKVVPLALGWWSVFTCLTAACRQFPAWMVVRGLFGLGEAPMWPGMNSAIAHWFPKRERGKAVGLMLLGSKFGPAVGIPVSVLIMAHWGWRAIFVVFGVFGLFVACAYYFFITSYPNENRFVNRAELEYIRDGQAVGGEPKKLMPPWSDFFRSTQFWAIGGQFAMAGYINYVFLAWLPVYLMEAHQFSLKQMGFGAILPELGFAAGNMFCGVASDYLIGKNIAGSKARAWFAGLGMLFCCFGLCLTALAISKWATLIWLTLALAFLGFTMNSSWTTCSDIAGRYTGTVSGWMNFVGNIVGGAAPIITAWVVTRYGWRAAILAAAVAGIIGAIFWIFVRPDVPLKHRFLEAAPM